MKAVMEVPIKKQQGGPRTAPHLEVDLPFAPYLGMPVWHVAWKNSRKVTGVTLDLNNEPFLIINLEPEEASDAKDEERLIQQYKGHGWAV